MLRKKKRYLWKKFGEWVPNDTPNKFSAYVLQIFAYPRLFQPTCILVICAYPPVIPDLGVLYKGIVVVTC